MTLAVGGAAAATWPGGGEPSAVKSDCCCAKVLGLTACAGLRWIIEIPPEGEPLSKVAALV
jgi:hypothetical protein